MSEERKIRNDILAVGLLAAIVFLVAALATFDPADPAFNASPLLNKVYQPDQLYFPGNASFENACGPIGAWTADMLINTAGIGAYFLVIGLIAMELALFKRQAIESPWLKTTGWTLRRLSLYHRLQGWSRGRETLGIRVVAFEHAVGEEKLGVGKF